MRFVGFLVLYAGWIAAYAWARGAIRRRFAWIATEIVLSALGLVGLVWILTGFFDPVLALLLLVAPLAALLIAGAGSLALQEAGTPWRERWTWAVAEWRRSRRKLAMAVLLLSALPCILYPVLAWSVVSAHPVGSPQALRPVLQLTLGLLVAGLLASLPSSIGVLLSRDLDPHTRQRVLVWQAGTPVVLGLYLALLARLLATPGVEGGFGWLGAVPTVGPGLLLLLLALFTLGVLVPYQVGWSRSKSHRQELLKRQQERLESVVDELELHGASGYAARLAPIRDRLEQEAASYLADTWLFGKLDRAGSADELDADEKHLLEPYRASRALDPRVRYRDFLIRLGAEVAGAVSQAAGGSPSSEREIYARRFRAQLDEVSKQAEVVAKESSLLWIVGGFVVSSLTSQYLQVVTAVVSERLRLPDF